LLVVVVVFLLALLLCYRRFEKPNMSASSSSSFVEVPRAKRERKEWKPEIDGEPVRVDHYAWLRDRENREDEVMEYLKAENAYTEAQMECTKELQETLYEEFVGRIEESDESVPVKDGNYLYFHRTVKGKEYKIYCRVLFDAERDLAAQLIRNGDDRDDESEVEVLLDVNRLVEDGGFDFLKLGAFDVSPCGKLLAYSTDSSGDESFAIVVKDLASGALLGDCVSNAYYGVRWSNDSKSLFYSTLDETHQPTKVFRHRLGTAAADDTLLYEEHDAEFWMSVDKTCSNALLLITLESSDTSEVRWIDLNGDDDTVHVVHAREEGVLYELDHHPNPMGDGVARLFITTNADGAQDFKLMECALSADEGAMSRANWRELLAHVPGRRVSDVECFAGHVVVKSRENASMQVDVAAVPIDANAPFGGQLHRVQWPDPIYALSDGASTPDFASTRLRAIYDSLVTPRTDLDVLMDRVCAADADADAAADDALRTLKVAKIPSGYDSAKFRCERIWVKSSDPSTPDVRIPVSFVAHHERFVEPGPMLLYGYGSYEISIDAHFDSKRISLLERGMAFAIAHVRGGGEMGRGWYESGKLGHKKRSFTDFIDVAEHFVKSGRTSSASLVAIGRSAGGLLMGGIANLRPDLFRAVIADVPFVDVVSTMSDESIPLTAMEWREWGCPTKDRDAYRYMLSYSPYDNIDMSGGEQRQYPIMLIQGGLNDKRVCYWEPAKYTARLRHMHREQRNDAPREPTDRFQFLLKMQLGAGHFGKSGRYEVLREWAFEMAFILHVAHLSNFK
jgi:oligopeptidase B